MGRDGTPWIRLALTLGLAAACLLWVLWGVDLAGVAEAAGAVELWRVGAVGGFMMAAFAMRVVRYQLLLGDDRPGWWRQVVACGVSYMALHVLPLRLGEFVRPLLLERDGVRFGTSIGGIALERVADLVALVGMVLLSAWAVQLPGTIVVSGIDVLAAAQQALGVMVGVLLIGLMLAPLLVEPAAKVLGAVPVVGSRLVAFARRFAASVRGLAARPMVAAAVMGLTVLIWASTVATVSVLLAGFEGLPAGVGPALVVTTVTVAGTLAVPTPGSVGSFEVFCQATLGLFGVPPEVGVAFAGVWHLLVLGFNASLGSLLVLFEGGSALSVLRRALQGQGAGE